MEEFEKLVAESFQSEMLPLAENSPEPGGVIASDNSDRPVSEPDSTALEQDGEHAAEQPVIAGESVVDESLAGKDLAGEKDPAA